MAKKIAVSGSREHLKKSVALLLVRRGMATWVIPGSMIARHAAKTAVCVDIRFELRAAPEPPTYIPEHLPAPELPGIRFQPTQEITHKRLRAQTPQLHYLPRLEQQQNLFVSQ